MRARGPALALTVACLLLAPVAAADQQVGLGDLVNPSLGLLDGALLNLGEAVAPTPAAPILLPAIDLGRLVVQVLRATASATILGAQDGDVGSEFGTPDEVGVRTEEQVVVDGVAVPGQDVTVPGRTVTVAVPGVDLTVVTPPIGVAPRTLVVPGREVPIDVPRVVLPGVTVTVPPLAVDTPPVGTPPVRLTVPEVEVPGQKAHLDVSGADVTVQELHGDIHLGPAGTVPFSVGPHTVGQSLLPSAVPRTFDAETPALHVVDETEVLDQPAREVLPAQHLGTEGRQVHVLDETEAFPGAHLTTLEVEEQRVDTPGVTILPSQEVPVHTDPLHVADVEVPGQRVTTEPVVVTEEQVVAPALDHRADPFGDVDDFGYVGYGQAADSSLYPFACTAVVGCEYGRPLLQPYVRFADAAVEAAARLADGPLVVEEPHLVFPQ